MKSASKWLLASGTLLIAVGFLLPVISVSRQDTENIYISLLQIAGFSYWFFLYLVPIGALTVFLLALIPIEDQKMKTVFLIGQIGGLGFVSLLLLGIFTYFLIMPQQLLNLGISIPAGLPASNFDIWPGIGLFILLLGIGLAIVGVLAYFFPAQKKADQAPLSSSLSSPDGSDETKFGIKDVYLEAIKGKLTGRKFFINEDDFSIGRARNNNLQLSNTSVSRLHVRLRHAEGSWFIQDQNSKIGILVNEKLIKAGRLSSGDRIQIGDDTFVFYS